MRIIYGVHGYGRGHATRTLAILPELCKRHQVLLLAGGDAYSAIWPDYQVVRIPTLGFAYGPGTGRRSNWHTLRRNLSGLLDLKLRGPVFEMVQGAVEEFAPDLVISDAEAWTHHVAHRLGIPRISVDHIGILAYCRPRVEWRDRLEAKWDTLIYKALMGRPDRIIVSSFYDAPPRHQGVRVVSTLVRRELHGLTPTVGEHLLVYFNQGHWQMSRQIRQALRQAGCPVRVYGSYKEVGRDGNLTFLPLSGLPFLEDLASCRGVISTAGNQLMGEAMFLGKPVLVMPEHCVEQRLNAAAVRRLGIGMRTTPKRFSAAVIRTFLDRQGEFADAIRRQSRNGLREAMTALESFIGELVPSRAAATDLVALA